MKLSGWRDYRMHKGMDGPLQGNLKEFITLFCAVLCHLATVMYPTYKLLPMVHTVFPTLTVVNRRRFTLH